MAARRRDDRPARPAGPSVDHVSILLIANLALLAGLTAWLLDGVARATLHYLRTGAVARAQANAMLTRGAIAVATSAVWMVVR